MLNPIKIRQKMVILADSTLRTKSVDLCFSEQSSPIVVGVRLVVGRVDSDHIQAALIGVLDYADESRRTVADVVEV